MTNVIDIDTREPVVSNVIFEAAPEEHWPDKHYTFEAVCGEEGLGVDLLMLDRTVSDGGLQRVFMSHSITAVEAERLGNALIEAVRSGRVSDLED